MNQKIKLPDGREVTIRVQNAESYVPNPQNTNKGKERGKAALDDSLQNSGFHRGIVVAKDGTVINGNHTYQSASELGVVKSWIEVEVEGDVGVVTKRIDWKNAEDPNAILAAIADNRTSALNLEFDPEILEQALQQLEEAGKDIPDTILTKEEIEQLLTASNEWMNDEQNEGLTDPDEIPDEEFTETRVKRGDIWQLGRHRVMCGDSTVITDVERLMNGEKADMVFTSPPYSDMRQYEEGTILDVDHLSQIFEWDADFFIVNLGLKFKDTEVVPYWDDWIKNAKDRGLKLLAWNVWDKTISGSIASATNMFMLTHEWIFVFGERRKTLNRIIPNQLEKYAKRYGDDFLDGIPRKAREFDGSISVATSKAYTHHQLHSVVQQTPELGKIRDDHPATFPVGLPEKYILSLIEERGICGEPFLGSGTTLIACEKTGRTCYGMELSEKYCDVILKRWEDFTGEKAVLHET